MSHDVTALPFCRVYTGMPVYNGERYLEQSILSNLNQTFDDFGLIIADNASTDRTSQICQDLAAKDPRITYILNPKNLGAAGNYLRCFNPSNCEYFRWSNADDLIDPTLIEQCVAVLDSYSEVVLAYGATRLIDGDGNLISDYDDNLNLPQDSAVERFITYRKNVGLSNVLYGLIRKDSLSQTALFGNYVASDINLIAELTLYGKFKKLPETLFERRIHEQASSFDREDTERQKDFWNPGARKLSMQMWRSMVAYYRAVSNAPIASKDKRQLYMYLNRTMYWTKGLLWSEFTDYLKLGLLRRS